jgi:hypothetical protein
VDSASDQIHYSPHHVLVGLAYLRNYSVILLNAKQKNAVDPEISATFENLTSFNDP